MRIYEVGHAFYIIVQVGNTLASGKLFHFAVWRGRGTL
jgi:hypothetical protein